MLKVASFSITDAAGINELLSKYRLASGAHILVSSGGLFRPGRVCIPYEDGEPENAAQKIVAIKEQQLTLRKELDIIVHSQKVMDLIIADAQERLTFALGETDKNRSNKALEEKRRQAEEGLTQAQNQKVINAAEIVRIQRNVDMFDEEIATLGRILG